MRYGSSAHSPKLLRVVNRICRWHANYLFQDGNAGSNSGQQPWQVLRARLANPRQKTVRGYNAGLRARQLFSRQSEGIFHLGTIREFAPREIARSSALAGDFFKDLLEKGVHVFGRRGMLRKEHLTALFSREKGDGFFCFGDFRRQQSEIFWRHLVKRTLEEANSLKSRRIFEQLRTSIMPIWPVLLTCVPPHGCKSADSISMARSIPSRWTTFLTPSRANCSAVP